MAKFSLHIETSDVSELAEIALRIAVGSGGAVGTADAPSGAEPDPQFDVEPKPALGASVAAALATYPQVGMAPMPDKPRRGRPAKVEAAPAPVAAEPAPVDLPGSVILVDTTTLEPKVHKRDATPEPAPTAPAAAPAGEITYDTLKETLTQVLGVKSAKDAQDIIREATGGRAASLTQCQADDYPAVVAALRAVLQ